MQMRRPEARGHIKHSTFRMGSAVGTKNSRRMLKAAKHAYKVRVEDIERFELLISVALYIGAFLLAGFLVVLIVTIGTL